MAKPKIKPTDEDNGGQDRKTTQLTVGTHKRLEQYCGESLKMWSVVDAAMTFMLEQDSLLLDAVVNRRRVGSERLRAAYCQALQGLTAQVCGQPDGISRQTFADTSGVPSAPADGPSSRHARAR